MEYKKLNFHFCLISSALGYVTLLTGCTPTAYIGAATEMTTCASEERTLKTVWIDSEIKVRIQSQWSKYQPDLLNQVNIIVHQGRVLLTGVVHKSQMQIEAVRLVWKVPNIKQVIDETVIGQEGNFTDVAQDTWISTQLNSTLTADDEIRSSNYKIQTVNNIIYLIGVAQNKKELDKVTHYARHIESVKKVVSHVVIKGQEKPLNSITNHKTSDAQNNQSVSYQRPVTRSSPSRETSSHDGIVEIDTDTPIIQDDPVKVQSLESPNTGSSFQ